MATRWGILSSGKISQHFTIALNHLPSTEHQVVAVAARRFDSAQEFAEKFDVPNAYGSYEELCQNPDIDVIYIGTIHPHHYDACKLALNGGKHVLCEKPMSMNTKQATEILELAKKRKLFFMEGFWSRFFPVYHRLREAVSTGEIGEPGVVQASFGFDANSGVQRLIQKELGGGALLNIGCYPVQLAEMVFGKPSSVHAVCTMQPTEVDETTVITCRYPGNKMAVLTCSLSCALNNKAFIHGSKGMIEIPEKMWSPQTIIVNGEREHFNLPVFGRKTIVGNSEGFTYEAQHVREMLLEGALESPLMSHESSLNIIGITDEARRQMGVVYDADIK